MEVGADRVGDELDGLDRGPAVAAHIGRSFGARLDPDLVYRYTQVSYELVGPSASSAVMKVEQTVVDAKGRVLSRSSHQKAPAERRHLAAMNAAPFACLNDRDREGFQRHNFWEMLDQDGNEFVHFRYFPYSQRDAQEVEGRPTQQWLVCATGGVDAQDGSRSTVSGPVVAYRNEHATYKIGQIWREGKTPADHTVTLGFQVGKGPVSVNGSIQQNSTEKLKGSPLALSTTTASGATRRRHGGSTAAAPRAGAGTAPPTSRARWPRRSSSSRMRCRSTLPTSTIRPRWSISVPTPSAAEVK